MKRLAPLLAAAALGTGCIWVQDPCDTRDVVVEWSGFDGPDAVADRSCAAAGVSYVDLFLDDRQVVGPLRGGHFRCDAYAVTVAGVGPGTQRLTVEGLAADGATITHRAERTFAASGCGDLRVSVAPAAGFVDLEYAFHAGGAPLPPASQVCGGAWLWLSIYDATANATTVLADAGASPEAFSCGGPFRLALPAGDHVLDWMEERGAAPGYALVSADCTARPFTIRPAAAVAVPVALDRGAVAACGG